MKAELNSFHRLLALLAISVLGRKTVILSSLFKLSFDIELLLELTSYFSVSTFKLRTLSVLSKICAALVLCHSTLHKAGLLGSCTAGYDLIPNKA